jgi:hypothetical protein
LRLILQPQFELLRCQLDPFFKIITADEENLPSPFLEKNNKKPPQAKAAESVGPMTNLTAITPGTSTSTSTSTSSSTTSTVSRGKRRPSGGLLLRAVAAANNVGRRGITSSTSMAVSPVLDNGDPQIERAPSVVTPDNQDEIGLPRPSLASARKASEEARKALLQAWEFYPCFLMLNPIIISDWGVLAKLPFTHIVRYQNFKLMFLPFSSWLTSKLS